MAGNKPGLDVVECIAPNCTEVFTTENGMRRHVGHVHDKRALYIEALEDLEAFLGRLPTTDDLSGMFTPSYQTYVNCFGSWNGALRMANFETTLERDPDYLLRLIHEAADDLGRRPKVHEMGDYLEDYSYNTYYVVFGAWTDALLEAGYDSSSQSQNNESSPEDVELEQAKLPLTAD